MAMFDTYIGTTSGLHVLRDGELTALGLAGEQVTAVHAARRDGTTVVLAGSYGNGLFRSPDDGRTWARVEAGLTAPALRCIGPYDGALLAGTEPGAIFRSEDGGLSWSELEGFAALPGRERWFLPYSPRAGAVRSIHASAGRLLAAVEVGGLARSDDGGRSWVCEPVIADEDIHHIAGHPHDDEELYASLGLASLSHREGERPQLGGIARSRDGGRTWEKVETDYTRATLIPSTRPDLLLAGPAPRVGRSGRIVVSRDGGDSWEPAAKGIETPMPDMVELFVESPDGLVWAICSRGRLLHAEPGDWTWHAALPGLDVKSIAFLA
jgi:photosystem II stability/assembly factor-like uncharacterized protein